MAERGLTLSQWRWWECVWRRGNPEVYRGFTVKSGGVKSWEARKAFGGIVKKVEKGGVLSGL